MEQQDVWILSKDKSGCNEILITGSLQEVMQTYRLLIPNPCLAPTPSEIRLQGYWLAGDIRIRQHPDYAQGARGEK